MTEENTSPIHENEVGNVVWFDQKKGFGFIKVITPESNMLNKDIFVHYTSIQSVNRFKKLYPGENVSLDIAKNTDQNNKGKEYISKNVRGLYGTTLLVDNPSYSIKVIRKRERDDEEEA